MDGINPLNAGKKKGGGAYLIAKALSEYGTV